MTVYDLNVPLKNQLCHTAQSSKDGDMRHEKSTALAEMIKVESLETTWQVKHSIQTTELQWL